MPPVTILYVEDSDDLRETIGMLMEAPDRDITTCATAEEALAVFAEREFDVLITDVSLPGMSGTDMTRKLLATRPNQWVVLCSGYPFGDAVSQFGPNVRSLLKPFEPEDLEALLIDITSKVRDAVN